MCKCLLEDSQGRQLIYDLPEEIAEVNTVVELGALRLSIKKVDRPVLENKLTLDDWDFLLACEA